MNKKLINIFLIIFVCVLQQTPITDALCTSQLKHSKYCSYLKQIELNELINLSLNDSSISIDLNKHVENINDNLANEIIYVYHTHSDSNKNDENQNLFDDLFEFKISNSAFKFSFNKQKIIDSKSIIINSLLDKTVKFKLVNNKNESTLPCYIIIDFYLLESVSATLINDNNKNTFVYYETFINDINSIKREQLEIDLKYVLPEWCEQRYSIGCFKCDTNLTLMISNDILQIESNKKTNLNNKLIFEDLIVQIDQELEDVDYSSSSKTTFLNIRIYNDLNLIDLKSKYRQRRYSNQKKSDNKYVSSLGNKQQQAPISSLSSSSNNNNNANSNTLKLAINEDTIGLQTKLKVYDYVWSDYQLNASDYVKERIQLIAPDNPILNITKPFDYEIGGAEHNFQIIFTRKSDKQRPIIDKKSITIKVLDINDEPPVWKMDEPVPYTAVVERDPRPGLLVFEFIAHDPDKNSEIVYTLHSKSPNTSRLVMQGGKLYTEGGAPFQHDTYKILVSAHDSKAASSSSISKSSMMNSVSSTKPQEIFAELIIIVGKKAPQFYQTEYKVNISENSPIGYNVVQMRAKSFNPDPFNKKHLRYSLVNKQNQQSDEFSIYSENGTVILARKVDYETEVREYNLIVHVTEQSGWLLTSSAKLNIYIEDYNDNAPQFTLSEYVRAQPVPEDLNTDTFIIQVEVQDRDSSENSEIKWQVSNPNFYVVPFSDTDSTRAKIYNSRRLDFEIPQHMYRFDVIACDKGQPSLCASAKVSVSISNVNDEKPKFDQKVILATLDENVPSGAYVTTVQATDGDGDRIFFKLKDESGPFEINRESGIVKVKADQKINPKEDYYNLTIYAEDDGSCCCQTPNSAAANNKVQLKYLQVNPNCKSKTNREEATLVIKIRDINDHAPKFHYCDSYSRTAQVEEEKPIGTNVIQVEAKDNDKGENGEVEYEILSTHSNEKNMPFRIDPLTGLIQTNLVFDRESNGKFNEYSITVKAKDRGKPHPLSDACSFRIKINDINDHAPSFYESEYKLSIKYGTKPKQNIQRIIASDLDSGKNAEIKYRIEQSGQFAQYFNVDELTGMISLRKEIAHNIKKPIQFNLIAEDNGFPPKSSSVPVTVTFADRDNEPPKWLPETEKRFERVVRIPEAISLNQIVETLDAESNYAPNSKLIFDFSPKPQPESFIIQQEKIAGTNRYRGKIIVYQPLDAETQNFYELHVRVQNAAAQPMEINGVVKVEILDSNDNIPLFTSPTYLANVSENSPPGTYVTKVTAEDKDISAPNNVIQYSIGDPEHSRKFQVDPYTGNITTRVELNREEIKVYFIDVTACDSAMSDRPNMNTPNCRTANVRIDVADTNDNQPFFNETLYEATVLENAERGTSIITIQANDLDENSQLRYIITDGNEENVFAVRETIGEIYAANNGKLDYETRDEYLLTLTVSDGIHNATTKVKINLIDVNDNPPVFTELPPYEIELVEEDLNFPRVILKINATDGDTKRPNTIVFKINYNYTQNGTSFRPFEINPHTGEILLHEKLDRDYPNGRPVWSFNVIASDEGGQKGSMDSTAVINVRLIDINDNAPVFDRPPYVGHILENSKPGSLIMSVTANDYDDPQMGQNAMLRYQIAENKKFGNLDVFSINDTTGQIYQNLMLDREQIDKYTIEVCATDGSGKRGCGQVTIYVDDANDQAPMFQSNTYTETINEDWPIGERVLVVTATDKDQGINSELSYGLKSECLVRNLIYTGNDDQDCVDGVREPKYFKVDTEREANSGFIKLAKAVNFDPPDYHRLFKLNVSVSDGVSQNYTTIFINIADVNDEAPKFKEPVKNIPIYESIAPLTIITNFTAEDLDSNEVNKRFSYSLDRKSEGSHEFTIDQNGNLYNLETLDREVKDKYILRIFATDEGYPPQTGIATLNLELIDVNDNHPVFAENYRPIIMENTPAGQFVVNVKGKDLDDPTNGPPFTFEFPDQLNYWPPSSSKKDAKFFNMTFIQDNVNRENSARIHTLTSFDREGVNCRPLTTSVTSFLREYDRQNQCKEYKIPIIMKDSGNPPMSGTNYLLVTIGDLNDNVHYSGTKKIFVYDYKGSTLRSSNKETLIGTVYAEDKDDWDMSDKEFRFVAETDPYILSYFDLVYSVFDNKFNETYTPGSIIMKAGIKLGQYEFKVSVKDLTRPDYEAQISTVQVTLKQIGDDVVTNSGSIRLSGTTAEKLLETRFTPNQKSLLNEMQAYLAKNIYKLTSENNLEFFSIINNKVLTNTVDLRFSAHGSPRLKSERLNGILAHNRSQFQQWLSSMDSDIQLISVGIDECQDSEKRCKDGGCKSTTTYYNLPALVNSNETALVGVFAVENSECVCKSLQGYTFADLNTKSCADSSNYCLNGGMCLRQGSIQKCQCPRGYDGPRCQKTIRHFNNSGGFVWLPAVPQCQDLVLSLEFITLNNKGLLFYNGPINNNNDMDKSMSSKYQQDFIALQLDKGKLVFQIRQGINGKSMSFIFNNFNRTLNDGIWHRVDIFKTNFKYRITIDRCIDDINSFHSTNEQQQQRIINKNNPNQLTSYLNGCEHEFQIQIHDLFININQYYPLQLGGLYDKQSVPKSLDYRGNFIGCIRNLKVNGELFDLEIDTPASQGFQQNSANYCPRTDKLCNPSNDTNYCLNGVCDANFYKSECTCKPGYRGRNCEFKALPFDFQTPNINKKAGSYLKYRYVYQSDNNKMSAYDSHLKKFTKIQLLFRTRENTTDRYQTLFQITSPNRAQYVYLEIYNNRLQFRYDIGGGENSISISNVPINDGKWHFAKADRYGKEASLIVDDGEGLKMNYTFGLPNGAKEMDVDRDSIFLGAKVVQIKVSGYEISRDYHDSCMMDVRFDEKPLPYTQQEEKGYEDIAIKMEAVNVKDGCQSVDYCTGIFCMHNQKCVDQWRLGECQCAKGQILNGTKCIDLNDCNLCHKEGTKYCEKYDDNKIIAYENFNDNYLYENNQHQQNPTNDYPPDNWFFNSDFNNELRESQNIWKLTSDETVQVSGHKCVCRKGYYGPLCNAQASKRAAVFMSYEAWAIILLCLIVCLVLILSFIAYSRSRRPTPKHYMLGVDPNDEVRETIINYVEEGCPDVDQSAYDITQLAKPLGGMECLGGNSLNMSNHQYSEGSTAIDGEFQPAIPKQKPPLQDISFIRRDVPPVTQLNTLKALRPQNTDVGDFINNKLREIDNDPVQPPYDSLQEYAYEGEGSMYGSNLSSLDMKFEETANNNNHKNHNNKPNKKDIDCDSDLECIKDWGPKFNKISDIYGLNSENEQEEEDEEKQ